MKSKGFLTVIHLHVAMIFGNYFWMLFMPKQVCRFRIKVLVRFQDEQAEHGMLLSVFFCVKGLGCLRPCEIIGFLHGGFPDILEGIQVTPALDLFLFEEDKNTYEEENHRVVIRMIKKDYSTEEIVSLLSGYSQNDVEKL